MSAIKSVAHAGAAGSLGVEVLKALVEAGFAVRVLSRQSGKVPAPFASQVKEVVVDYNDPASLKSALEGVNAVVSTLGAPAVGQQQRALVDAAVDAGVQRFIPSNFGCDQQNPLTRQLPVFAEKVKTEDYLVEKAAQSSLSYTFIYNNLFLDWGFSHGSLANAKEKKVTLYNGGDLAVSVTRLATVAKGVVGVLKNPEATKNRSVRIEDGKISFKTIAAIAQEAVTGAWTIDEKDTNALKDASDKALAAGTLDGWVWFFYILQGGTNAAYGPSFENIDNDVLGLARLSDKDLHALTKELIVQTASA
ncbi:oxidoreductase [Fusarium albosuccineum]|uniref:Oxidoreductase n=1 Tax=Fusarium albosuccineum TaxID=1237068 RepID=A0A8H4L9W0_9HYPO|nr:oxidoreductase [Fusarium albosuccineum]